jgi:hypothetical protein
MKDSRPRVAVTFDKEKGNTCAISPTHSDRAGWQAQLPDAFGARPHDFLETEVARIVNALGAFDGRPLEMMTSAPMN